MSQITSFTLSFLNIEEVVSVFNLEFFHHILENRWKFLDTSKSASFSALRFLSIQENLECNSEWLQNFLFLVAIEKQTIWQFHILT